MCTHWKLSGLGARTEKDFGLRKFVALISDLIQRDNFPWTHFKSSKNFDYPREDSCENSLCNNTFYTGRKILCIHTENKVFGLMCRLGDFIELESHGDMLVWKMRFSFFSGLSLFS